MQKAKDKKTTRSLASRKPWRRAEIERDLSQGDGARETAALSTPRLTEHIVGAARPAMGRASSHVTSATCRIDRQAGAARGRRRDHGTTTTRAQPLDPGRRDATAPTAPTAPRRPRGTGGVNGMVPTTHSPRPCARRQPRPSESRAYGGCPPLLAAARRTEPETWRGALPPPIRVRVVFPPPRAFFPPCYQLFSVQTRETTRQEVQVERAARDLGGTRPGPTNRLAFHARQTFGS